ncbi:MAG: ribosomal protein S18-alanine N-acetyltransferase [Candidatus Latescibacteria bacterium]|nr:ribosomal protein S18-alanine N-acetyltransferase [Candidatus Latescibacterota bacterium]NIM22327.1 ribosomal protein S18-alanine N-acetyltransferase [Candidatus Latescibacterota bacterium]NIM66156.1 ribosomal protein S18-alanine N-acetyltransferase [Candidatus Latescibacterota bacterium]NIO02564.1 ribosomal protein S18-alanine N-acetyltransferase [Candidatus Latescibacterota bacterium]NIO29478.1 ribosomal protein S18-alanine N-acetyltransferase [Candidatus Latescibacterota bacterium]
MRVSHLPEVLAIESEVFFTPWTEGMFRQELSRGWVSRVYVALLEERVVGYEIAWFVEDSVHLVNIAVAQSLRRRKIGSVLLENILDEAIGEGKRHVTLEVRKSNRAAQAFYRSFGFELVGIREGYYSDNHEDAVLMTLFLPSYVRKRRRHDETDRI